MKNLGLILASLMTNEQIIEKIEEGITLYKIDPSKKNLDAIKVASSLLLGKHTVDSDPKGLEGVMNQMEKLEKADNLLTPSGN